MISDESPTIHIVRERMVYTSGYGDLYDDDVEFRPRGVRGQYLRWRWREPYSVAVLALADAGTALLIRNFRHSARGEVLEAVKGFGNETRAPRDFAHDELDSEAGFIADDLTFLGITVTDPSFAYHPMHCFVATGGIKGHSNPEASEAIRGLTPFALAQTPMALRTGQIEDSVTLLLLWHAYALL